MGPAGEDPESRRLRQTAETAGSLAPRDLDRAIRRGTPPASRRWSAMGPAERFAAVAICVLLVGCIITVATLMAARGHGVIVAFAIGALAGTLAYAYTRARPRPPGS